MGNKSLELNSWPQLSHTERPLATLVGFLEEVFVAVESNLLWSRQTKALIKLPKIAPTTNMYTVIDT